MVASSLRFFETSTKLAIDSVVKIVGSGESYDSPVFTTSFDFTLFIFLFDPTNEPVHGWTD